MASNECGRAMQGRPRLARAMFAILFLVTVAPVLTEPARAQTATPAWPSQGFAHKPSQLNSKLSYLQMIANRVFWTILVTQPFTAPVSEPECYDAEFFKSHFVKGVDGRYQLSRDAFVASGLDENKHRVGAEAVWPGRCKPVGYQPNIHDNIRAGHVILRWPDLIDDRTAIADIVRIAGGSRQAFEPYRITFERAKEIYLSRNNGIPPDLSKNAARLYTSTYPSVELYFDRNIVDSVELEKWLDLTTARSEKSGDGWIRMIIKLRMPPK